MLAAYAVLRDEHRRAQCDRTTCLWTNRRTPPRRHRTTTAQDLYPSRFGGYDIPQRSRRYGRGQPVIDHRDYGQAQLRLSTGNGIPSQGYRGRRGTSRTENGLAGDPPVQPGHSGGNGSIALARSKRSITSVAPKHTLWCAHWAPPGRHVVAVRSPKSTWRHQSVNGLGSGQRTGSSIGSGASVPRSSTSGISRLFSRTAVHLPSSHAPHDAGAATVH